MDPWSGNNSIQQDNCHDCHVVTTFSTAFEDDFKPTIGDTLPDSKQYLETLERRLRKIKNDPDILQQLAAKREECMQQLLTGRVELARDEDLDTPLSSSVLLRTVAPERQALTTGEVLQLIHYDHLEEEEVKSDHSDSASL